MQRFYEGPPVDLMIEKCKIKDDSTIFEFGFGTGYLADELLTKYPQSTYIGVDVSKTMHKLATQRLKGFDSERVDLRLAMDTVGAIKAMPDRSIDRFISTYVFDLLPKSNMSDVIFALQRKLKKDGKICLVSLTKKVDDSNVISKMILNGWNSVARFCSLCLGGCRPIDLRYPFDVTLTAFKVVMDTVSVAYGILSEIVIAEFNKGTYSKRKKK